MLRCADDLSQGHVAHAQDRVTRAAVTVSEQKFSFLGNGGVDTVLIIHIV